MAVEKSVRELIVKASKTKKCTICKSKFDFKNIRYYCESCSKFYCIKCCISNWVFDTKDDEEKERPVCRCETCNQMINTAESDLQGAMATMDFDTVHKVLSEIVGKNIDIDVKLRHEAEVLHLKLEKEKDIRSYIRSLDHVDNFRTILKSVKILNDKVENAKNLDVDLDAGLIQEVNKTTSRLISERNLRFEMEMAKVPESEHEHVNKLRGLIDKAQEHMVEQIYTD